MANPAYTEIFILKKLFEKAGIPFDFSERPLEHGWQICYPSQANCIFSVIELDGSYGSQVDKLEVCGPIRDLDSDNVIGFMSASATFKLIAEFHKKYVMMS